MEHDLPMILVSVGSSLIVGIASSYLTFRLQLERFMAMDKEREKHWVQWREGISSDVEELKKSANITELARMSQRVGDMERRLESIEHKLDERAEDRAEEREERREERRVRIERDKS